MIQFDFGRKTFAYLGTEATFKVNSCINIMCGVIQKVLEDNKPIGLKSCKQMVISDFRVIFAIRAQWLMTMMVIEYYGQMILTQTDFCHSRVAFTTEKWMLFVLLRYSSFSCGTVTRQQQGC